MSRNNFNIQEKMNSNYETDLFIILIKVDSVFISYKHKI